MKWDNGFAGGGLRSKVTISSTRSKQSAERYLCSAKRGGGGEGAQELPSEGEAAGELSNSADKRHADFGLGRRVRLTALGAGEASRGGVAEELSDSGVTR